ncbi:16S rRNA processing protein RimM [Allofrancisella guangzhouensis]|uniref:Ribosome maturation factor RimM n=1 Tax=Allofrancisella guangzhouensis TaxID=594679 RepID=A0A0A8E349_9GAMM|nr:ribosome maturation factor RimM [Allofrancisella guangzhouensis]AJC48625.1 16S rRNA-processing protein RimM [Allofrancisella guangzhouensis]MBK2027937.1 16S rRNA processing protein RimM [Allofrancisella guangzhouensis]MBK2043699.1 16S rRNA processing protein RimM [Allofrancisella guangzhouensis]MBK2046244.1 16S rRNA processing protein RimM [Allofrancisella guangzhouensis]
MSSGFVEVAKIGSTYKLNGELNLYSLANPVEVLLEYGDWYIQLAGTDSWQMLKGESVYRRADKIYIKLANVNDAGMAKKYVNALIGVPVEALPQPSEDEAYFKDLIGCEVSNHCGEPFGKVINIIETGANEVLVCHDGEHEYLIPYVKKYILKEEIDLKKIVVDWEYDF